MVRLEQIHACITEKETEASRKLEDLEQVIRTYNTLGCQNLNDHKIDLSASEVSSMPGVISPEADRLLAGLFTGYQPARLLNLDLRGWIYGSLQSLRKEIKERRKQTMVEDLGQRNLLDKIKEAIDERRHHVETVEHKRRAAAEEFERAKATTTTQKLQSEAQIWAVEKKMAKT